MALAESELDFWLAAAAAAPIIALAGLVSITDSAVVSGMIKQTNKGAGPIIRAARSTRLAVGSNSLIMAYSIINLLVQGLAFIASLWTLLIGRVGWFSGGVVMGLEASGFLYLLVIAWMAGRVGTVRREIEEAQARAAAEHLADIMASKFQELQIASKPEPWWWRGRSKGNV
jgi:hypothetical protein